MNEYPSVLVYRGIQKPLEFMGLRGRYVYVGAGALIAAVVCFVVNYILFGLLVSFILVLSIILFSAYWIFTKQKKGLHSKKTSSDIYVTQTLFVKK
jgi:hypothetical protein